jgi:uncharacterized protein YukE
MLRGQEWQGAAKDAFQAAFAQLSGDGQAVAPDSISGKSLLVWLEKAIRAEAANLREHDVRMEHTR